MKVNKMAVIRGIALALAMVVLAMAVTTFRGKKDDGNNTLGGESDIVQSSGYKAEKANGATRDEIVDLANRLATVASIRYTGWTEESEKLIDSTMYGEHVPEIKSVLQRGLQDREIALTEAFREVYDLLATGAGVGMPEEPGSGTLEYAPSAGPEHAMEPEPTQEGLSDAETATTEAELTPIPTIEPGKMTVDEYLDSIGGHIDEDGHILDAYGNPIGGSGVTLGIKQEPEENISEAVNSTLKEGGSNYDFSEWLQRCENGQVDQMDGRIEWKDGTPYLKLSSAAASADGTVSLLISGVMSKVYVGVDGALRGLVNDHAYDFEAFNYGFYEDGQLVVAVQTKDFEQSEGEEAETCSGIYNSLLRGDVVNDNGVYKFQPSETAVLYLTKSFDS